MYGIDPSTDHSAAPRQTAQCHVIASRRTVPGYAAATRRTVTSITVWAVYGHPEATRGTATSITVGAVCGRPAETRWRVIAITVVAAYGFPAATRRTAIAQGGAKRNPGYRRENIPRPNGADGGHARAWRDRHAVVWCAPLGIGTFLWVGCVPRVAPWAITVGPVGAVCGQVPDRAKWGRDIKANLKGLGYGG